MHLRYACDQTYAAAAGAGFSLFRRKYGKFVVRPFLGTGVLIKNRTVRRFYNSWPKVPCILPPQSVPAIIQQVRPAFLPHGCH